MFDLHEMFDGAGVLARQALRSPGASASTLMGLAQLCRRAGALEEAADLAALAAARGGTAPDVLAAEALVRIVGFLPAAERAAYWDEGQHLLPSAAPSKVKDPERISRVNPESRCSLNLTLSGATRQSFARLVRRAAAERGVAETLDVALEGGERVDVCMTCHGDGAFFRAHADTSETIYPDRLVSFVYYLHRTPKPFSGGDLLLYDRASNDGYSPLHYTRVPPADNTLIFFRSDAFHEVQPIHSASRDPADGRFTIHGWISKGPR